MTACAVQGLTRPLARPATSTALYLVETGTSSAFAATVQPTNAKMVAGVGFEPTMFLVPAYETGDIGL